MSDTYLPEIKKDQEYFIEINGNIERLKIVDIRISNVNSNKDFITVVIFKNTNHCFEENVKRIIGNTYYKLIK